MKIKLARLALQDLQATKDYISQDNLNVANAIIQRVIGSIENIARFPAMGRPGRVPHTKELVVSNTPLIIVYKIKQDTLFVVRVLHATRKWP